jgi:uncharacterized protein (TIGR01244 family)
MRREAWTVRGLAFGAVLLAVCPLVMAQTPEKQALEGVRNFTRVDATIGCAGATEVSALPAIARLGYRSVVNLRQSTESGAAIEESRQAATAAGMKYLHLPFDGSAPDPAVIDAFIAAVTDPANQPVFIHCGSANRVGGVWLAKRLLVDNWTEARAVEEATTIGLSSASLRQFVLDYVAAKRR